MKGTTHSRISITAIGRLAMLAMLILVLCVTLKVAYGQTGVPEDYTADAAWQWGSRGRDRTQSFFNYEAEEGLGSLSHKVVANNIRTTRQTPLVGDLDSDYISEIVECADGYLMVMNYTLAVLDQEVLDGCYYGQPSLFYTRLGGYGLRNFIAIHNATDLLLYAYNASSLAQVYDYSFAIGDNASVYGNSITCYNEQTGYKTGCIGKLFGYANYSDAIALDGDYTSITKQGYFLLTKMANTTDYTDPANINMTIFWQDKFNHTYCTGGTSITACWNETFSIEDWDNDDNMEFVAVVETDGDEENVEIQVFDIDTGAYELEVQIDRNGEGGQHDFCDQNTKSGDVRYDPIFHQFNYGDYEIVMLCPSAPTVQGDSVSPELYAWNSAGTLLGGYPAFVAQDGFLAAWYCGNTPGLICPMMEYSLARNLDNKKIVVAYKLGTYIPLSTSRSEVQIGISEFNEAGEKKYIMRDYTIQHTNLNQVDYDDWESNYTSNTPRLSLAYLTGDGNVDYVYGDIIIPDNETTEADWLSLNSPFYLDGEGNSLTDATWQVFDAIPVLADMDGDGYTDVIRAGMNLARSSYYTVVSLSGRANELPQDIDVTADTCSPVCYNSTVQYQASYSDDNVVYGYVDCDAMGEFDSSDFHELAPDGDVVGNCTYTDLGSKTTSICLTDSFNILFDEWACTDVDFVVQIGNCYDSGESDAYCDLTSWTNATDEYGVNDTDDGGQTVVSHHFDWSQCEYTGFMDSFEWFCPIGTIMKTGLTRAFAWIFNGANFLIVILLLIIIAAMGYLRSSRGK